MIGPVTSLLVAALLRAPAAPAEPVLLAREASGTVPWTGESALEIDGVRGETIVDLGEPGQMKFASASLEREDVWLPVEVWLDGDALALRPPREESATRRLFVWLPPSLPLRIRQDDGKVVLSSLQAPVDVRGERLGVEARWLAGPLTLELTAGEVSLAELTGKATLRGKDMKAVLVDGRGNADVNLEGGSVEVLRTWGDFQAYLRGSSLKVTDPKGSVSVRMSGGRAEIAGLEVGGRFVLDGSPIEVTSSRGEIELETNAAANLGKNEAGLHLTSDGGSFHVSEHEGLVEIQGVGGSASIAGVTGSVRVEGKGLQTQVQDVNGDVIVRTSSAEVDLQRVAGPVIVANEYGGVQIRDATQEVRASVTSGALVATGLRGPVQVTADGGDVRVSFASVPATGDSRIESTRGTVRLEFPPFVPCRVRAESSSGRVESDLSWVEVSDDGGQASAVGPGLVPHTVVVKAAGDIVLTDKAEASP